MVGSSAEIHSHAKKDDVSLKYKHSWLKTCSQLQPPVVFQTARLFKGLVLSS